MPASNTEIDGAVADFFDLTDEQRSVPHLEGPGTELAFRVAWARSGLVAAGALENAGRALWRLTPAGEHMGCDEVERARSEYLRNKRGKKGPSTSIPGLGDAEDDDKPTPDDDWAQQLLERLKQTSPAGFEHLSAALLRAAGFDDVEVTGRSGDGGIDGIGTYRPSGLISFHTAFQCKRYQGSVSASTVRDFRGSFVGRADRGIIITTGTFTRDAQNEASRAGANTVDLVDGDALCELLREHSLGVRTTTRTVEDIVVDERYFAQFSDD